MKLNLGCGSDLRPGYLNVDFLGPKYIPFDMGFQLTDLSKLPWPWEDESIEEILMLDFLEHFPYAQTEKILQEVWRILIPGGKVDIQVPDFQHCSYAVLDEPELSFQCNRCGWWFESGRSETTDSCMKCGQTLADIQDAAIHRLYGGQDVQGNWHHTAFTEDVLARLLERNGFNGIVSLENEHQQANWNIKLRAAKGEPQWGDQ
jgi:predicted SAM-dependent methyltransferase